MSKRRYSTRLPWRSEAEGMRAALVLLAGVVAWLLPHTCRGQFAVGDLPVLRGYELFSDTGAFL